MEAWSLMYDFVIHAFLFLGALVGTLFFAAVLFFIPVLITHELWVLLTNARNVNNEENNS
jgi:hypothetical protein